MPTLAEATELVHRYLSARVPLIVIQTIEPNRAMEALAHCASRLRALTYFEHSRTEGVRDLLTGQVATDETSLQDGLDLARHSFQARTNANFVFTEVEDLDTESTTSRHFAEMVRLAESRQGSIILVTSKPVWRGLGRLGMSEILDLPTVDELGHVLSQIIDDHRAVVQIEWTGEHVRRAAETLCGITEGEAVNILASMLAKGRLAVEDIPDLSRFKDRIFGEMTGIERIPLKQDYQVGGLRNLRRWLAQREELMKADLSRTPLRPPKGVLLVGVPGCGKSLSAKAIASQWDLPLYRLDMSGILGMYVGQSESQLREALETADRVAPCVLWIDEIEKALATGTGDSGTSRRLIGQFLFWLQESTSKVFMVATANDVSSLPPELLRKGRFDELFFVDLPDATDRAEILTMYFRRYLRWDPPAYLVEHLVLQSEGFSGSDIDSVIHDLGTKMFTHSNELPTEEDIVLHFSNVVPYSQTNPEDVAQIRAWGTSRCVPAGIPAADPTVESQQQSRRVVLL